MINNYPIVNIYDKESLKSKISSQLIYGERFQIVNKKYQLVFLHKYVHQIYFFFLVYTPKHKLHFHFDFFHIEKYHFQRVHLLQFH